MAERARGGRLGADEQVRRGLSRAGATTAAARSSTRSSSSRSTGPRRCSAPSTRTSSRTRAPRRTWRSTSACSQPGDTVLSLRLDHGGHLTHGLKVNFSGRLYTIVHYGVSRETGVVDEDEVRALAHEHRPKLILCGGSAYPRTVDTAMFRRIADEVGALLWCDMAHFAGLVAAGLHPNPVERLRRRHLDDPQDARRPALGPRPLPRGARAGDRPRRLPRAPGRAARARDRRQGDVLPDRRDRGVPRLPAAGARERRRARRDAARRRASTSSPAARTRTSCSSTCAAPSGRGRTPRSGSTRSADDEPQHRAVRRAAADDRLRRPRRHARRRRCAASTRRTSARSGAIIVDALADDADLEALARADGGALRAAAAVPGLPRLPHLRRGGLMTEAETESARRRRHRGDAPARPAQARAAPRRHDDDPDVPPARQRADAAAHVRGDEGPRGRGGRDRDAARAHDGAPDLGQEGRRLPDPARRGRDARRRALARPGRARRLHRPLPQRGDAPAGRVLRQAARTTSPTAT